MTKQTQIDKSIEKKGLKPFISLIQATKIPKLALIFGLIGSIITMIVGLSIPLLTRELVDGFSVEALSVTLIIIIFVVFVLQAVVDGISTYLLALVGQRIVASLRERMWFKLIRLPVSYFDKQASGESVSRVVNDTGIVKNLNISAFPTVYNGNHYNRRFHCNPHHYGLENDIINDNRCTYYVCYHDAIRKQNGKGIERDAG